MERYFGLVPAAGSGRRLGGELPKQYLNVGGAPLIVHAIRALLAEARIDSVFVVLGAEDSRFKQIDWGDVTQRVVPLYCGGETRTISVYNGLVACADVVDLDDWMLVHDAARPCLTPGDVARLMDAMTATEIGGLLAAPVADTLKEDNGDGRVARTIDRSSLWRALTPQMFRYGTLLQALGGGHAQNAAITDEASAVERLGFHPRLIAGMGTNIKVTLQEDLALVAAWMNQTTNPLA